VCAWLLDVIVEKKKKYPKKTGYDDMTSLLVYYVAMTSRVRVVDCSRNMEVVSPINVLEMIRPAFVTAAW
jgi:hypothetical protein